MSKVLPAFMYGNPETAAIRNEEKKCTGCRNLHGTLGKAFCGVGKRTLVRCNRFKEKQ